MRIKLSTDALLFLKREQRYLEHFNPRAAQAAMLQLRKSLRFLSEQPRAGEANPVLVGRRRFVSGDYVIHYRIEGTTIAVSHIHHGRQIVPELGKDPDL